MHPIHGTGSACAGTAPRGPRRGCRVPLRPPHPGLSPQVRERKAPWLCGLAPSVTSSRRLLSASLGSRERSLSASFLEQLSFSSSFVFPRKQGAPHPAKANKPSAPKGESELLLCFLELSSLLSFSFQNNHVIWAPIGSQPPAGDTPDRTDSALSEGHTPPAACPPPPSRWHCACLLTGSEEQARRLLRRLVCQGRNRRLTQAWCCHPPGFPGCAGGCLVTEDRQLASLLRHPLGCHRLTQGVLCWLTLPTVSR